MKLGILTSSRADFGIYLPLLKLLKADNYFDFEIICFGAHLSTFHGYTKDNIISSGFNVDHEINSVMISDTPNGVSSSIAITTLKFADFWKENKDEFDVVLCLGDRYEMFAAVLSGIPFQIKFAHIHGGETTLGAIDNIFRNSITLASAYHFVTTDKFKIRVAELTSLNENIYVSGALGIDNIMTIPLYKVNEFHNKYEINLSNETILVTYHPETVDYKLNKQYINELIKVIKINTDYQFLITMPNNDTTGSIVREELTKQLNMYKHVWFYENLGSRGYLTAMKYCSFLLGNTSSGIIEAASFGKYVINLGNRQKGREAGLNVINVKLQSSDIQETMDSIKTLPELTLNNIYGDGNSAIKIINVLKTI